MKIKIVALLLTLPFSMFAQTAKIKIDIDRKIGEIDPKIYGVFMEPIQFSGRWIGLPDSVSFNTMYGNLYDPSSPLADENGFRKDYIEAMRELKVTNMRWPGGNYVAGYNWQDGIGPKEQRPVRKDPAWGGIDNNHVGTDEWVQLNRSIGSENVICINLGLGTINDARYWVEYCNLEKETYYSDLRAKYGNREQFNIKYWCLGNEVDGSPWIMGYKNAEDYCKIAIEAAKAMRATDNTIKFISNGSSYYESTGKWIDWNWKVITELRDFADYISIHRYWDRTDNYYDYVGQSSFDIEEKINVVHSQIKVAKAMYPDMKPLYLSVDEWAPFGQNLLSTMAVAMYLNSFIRHADIVKMANFTLLTSLLGSDREKGTFKTPLFNTFKLFSNNCLGYSVDTYVECDTFNTQKYKGIPFLDVTTVYSEETNTVFINVVNRHKDNTITADIFIDSGEFTGKAEAKVITGDSLEDPFTFDQQGQYIPVKKEIEIEKNEFSYSFPAHSFTQIKVALKKK
ncbi:Intracellular exo-alpha-(1-_5)-L-arabinofuranosidase [subsurface metagenome]